MGAHKPLMPFGEATLIQAVIGRAAPQVVKLALDVPADMAQAYRARFTHAVLPDLFEEKAGPLCGIVTGLAWLDGDWLATFPCDTPFLPLDLVAQLRAHAHASPVIMKDMPVCGLWPKACLERLRRGVEDGSLRSVRGALEALGGRACEIDADDHAFFNVNAPQDLQEALRLCARTDAASRRP